MTGMSKDDRNALIRIVKARAKQSEREADSRAKILLSEIEDLMAAEYEARDALWDDSVAIAEEAKIKADEQIRARCAEFGVPAETRAAAQPLVSVPQSQLRRQRSPSGAEEPGRGKARRADHHRQG